MAVLTISRQIASLGDEVCRAVSEKIGFAFIDRKEIERRIIEMGFPAEQFKKFDEKKPTFFASLSKSRDEYLDYLQTAILEAAEENCILIGRGSSIVLRDIPNHVSLRFVGDEKTRAERLMAEHGWSEKEAARMIEESDTNRAGFLKSFFNADIGDISLFHAVLNTSLLSMEEVAQTVSFMLGRIVTEEKEAAGRKAVQNRLMAQRIVNAVILRHRLPIHFFRAEVTGENKAILHGISESSATVKAALEILASEFGGWKMKSAISISEDYKARLQ